MWYVNVCYVIVCYVIVDGTLNDRLHADIYIFIIFVYSEKCHLVKWLAVRTTTVLQPGTIMNALELLQTS
jgi:hypothetical protein